jgi:hypothetical protein
MGGNSAKLVFENGEWIVILRENDVELSRLFAFEHQARIWFDGQRIRMRFPLNDNAITVH